MSIIISIFTNACAIGIISNRTIEQGGQSGGPSPEMGTETGNPLTVALIISPFDERLKDLTLCFSDIEFIRDILKGGETQPVLGSPVLKFPGNRTGTSPVLGGSGNSIPRRIESGIYSGINGSMKTGLIKDTGSVHFSLGEVVLDPVRGTLLGNFKLPEGFYSGVDFHLSGDACASGQSIFYTNAFGMILASKKSYNMRFDGSIKHFEQTRLNLGMEHFAQKLIYSQDGADLEDIFENLFGEIEHD